MTTKKMVAPRSHKRCQGFSLVELLVGISLGVFVLLGLVTAMSGLLRGDSVAASRMGNELRNAVFIFERDVSRAAYNGKAGTAVRAGSENYANPFSVLDAATPGCVLYSYDLNSNGVLDLSPVDERFAVMVKDGQLLLRQSGDSHDCDASEGVWEPLLDPALVRVTSFSAVVEVSTVDVPSSTRGIQVRTLRYSITGALTKNPKKTMTHTNTLILPNDILS